MDDDDRNEAVGNQADNLSLDGSEDEIEIKAGKARNKQIPPRRHVVKDKDSAATFLQYSSEQYCSKLPSTWYCTIRTIRYLAYCSRSVLVCEEKTRKKEERSFPIW